MGAWIGERLNRCNGPVRFLIPEQGVSALDAPGQAFHDPAGRRGAVRRARAHRHGNAAPAARAPAARDQRSGVRRRAGPALSRSPSGSLSHAPCRTSNPARAAFSDMIRNGEPIIGGGAGTGLSAKCEEAGGIDLIIIYNSGRYRMAGRGSLAGMLAYGNANEIVREMAREVLPVVQHAPVIAGVNGTDPFCHFDHFLDELKAIGISGVQNFPTVGLIDGVFRANLEETGMGYGLEVDLVRRARAKDLLTTPYVFDPGAGEGDGRGRRGHRRRPYGTDRRRRDRGGDRAQARRLRARRSTPSRRRRSRCATTSSSSVTAVRSRRRRTQATSWRAARTATASTARAAWSGCRSRPRLRAGPAASRRSGDLRNDRPRRAGRTGHQGGKT